MRSILFFIALLFAVNLCAQHQSHKVLPWRSELSFNNYLLHKVHAQYDVRRSVFQEALQSEQALRSYRDSARIKYKKLLGTMPQKSALNPMLTGTLQKKGYRIEKIIYESLPHHHVTANFYIPEGNGPFPVVLLLCGHEPQGKAADTYQRTAILLALNGIAAFVIDPVSQAERHQITDASGTPLTRGGTTEHTLLNAAGSLIGSGTVAFELWDNLRGLDYLETRKEVDLNRIGCFGNSGGGNQTNYLIAFDDRIKVAAPCSYISNRERNFDLIGANDGCQHMVGEGEAGFEISDFSIMFAPKPMLILAGKYDFVDYTGTLRAFDELKKVYSVLGKSEDVQMFTDDDGHGISWPKREAAVAWFKKWFGNENPLVTDRNIITLPAAELNCTTSGQVKSFFTDEFTDVARMQQVAAQLKQERAKEKREIRKAVLDALNIQPVKQNLSIDAQGVIQQNSFLIQKVIARKQGELPVPILTVLPPGEVKRVVVWLHDRGKQHVVDSTGLIESFLKDNVVVIMADLGGLGELADPEQLNDPKYYNREYRNAVAALHIGSSLQAERTRNILVLLDYISQHEKLARLPVEVFAKGRAAIPALHAAVIDERMSSLNLYDCIPSFEDVLKRPEAKDWYSYVIPDVLRYYDIPDLKKALGKRLVSESSKTGR